MIVLVAGTGTGVGKTWVAAELVRAFRARGSKVAVRKPSQSYQDGTGPTDAHVLGLASGEEPTTVCPGHRWYEVAMAPPMAAALLGREPFTVDDLLSELQWPPALDLGVVEAVGGPRSPLAEGGDTVDLAKGLKADHTVLVAGAGLGTINAVLLCAGVLPPPPPLVLLIRYDPSEVLHRMNAEWLREREGLEVFDDMAGLVTRLR